MKKILAALFAATLIFSTVGATLLISDTPTAEAKKSYKSGKKASPTIIIVQISKNLRITLRTIMQRQIKIIQTQQIKQIQLKKVASSQVVL